MDDATIKLVLDLANNSRDVGELAAKLTELKTSAASVGQTYEILATSGHGYALVEHEIETATDAAVRAAVEQTQAQRAMNQILEECSTKASTAAANISNVAKQNNYAQQSTLQASYAVQDFVTMLSGGQGLGRALGAVQNNIPLLALSMGAGAGVAGQVGLASVAVGVLVDNFGRLYTAMAGGETEAETERLNKLAKAADAARIAIQKQVAALDAKDKAASPEEAKVGQEAISKAGGAGAVSAEVQKQLADESTKLQEDRQKAARLDELAQKSADQLSKSPIRTPGDDRQVEAYKKAADEARKAVAEAENQIRETAQKLVLAATEGNKEAINELIKRQAIGNVGDALDAADPAKAGARQFNQQAAQKQIGDAIGSVLQPVINNLRDVKEQRQAKRKDDALVDMLNAQGEEIQADFEKKQKAENEPTAAQKAMRNQQGRQDDARMRQMILGTEFQRRSQFEGYNPDQQTIELAAKMVDRKMHGGQDKSKAMFETFKEILANEQRMTMQAARQEQRWNQMLQQARTVGQAQDNLLRRGVR